MTSEVADNTASEQQKRVIGRPFVKGQSGNPNGRPAGSRQKLEQAFVDALYDDFKTGGVEAIEACRKEKPDVYLNVIAKIIPKQVDVSADESLADLAQGLQAVAGFLSQVAAEASGADHAGMVPDGSVLLAGVRPQAH